jgi:hypothetical protein
MDAPERWVRRCAQDDTGALDERVTRRAATAHEVNDAGVAMPDASAASRARRSAGHWTFGKN